MSDEQERLDDDRLDLAHDPLAWLEEALEPQHAAAGVAAVLLAYHRAERGIGSAQTSRPSIHP